MKLYHLTLIMAVLLGFMSCKNDDDGTDLLSQEDQNQVDDLSLIHI